MSIDSLVISVCRQHITPFPNLSDGALELGVFTVCYLGDARGLGEFTRLFERRGCKQMHSPSDDSSRPVWWIGGPISSPAAFASSESRHANPQPLPSTIDIS